MVRTPAVLTGVVGLVLKTLLVIVFVAGAWTFWILTKIAREPQTGGSVTVLAAVAVLCAVLSAVLVVSLVRDLVGVIR